jgi:hypothetical protein
VHLVTIEKHVVQQIGLKRIAHHNLVASKLTRLNDMSPRLRILETNDIFYLREIRDLLR